MRFSIPAVISISALVAGCSSHSTAEPVATNAEPLVSPLIDIGDHASGPGSYQVWGGDVAYGAGEYLAVWQRVWDESYYAARISPAGVLLDATPIRLEAPVGPVGFFSPYVGFDGTNFHVVWAGATGMRTARVAPDGTVIDVPTTFGKYNPLGMGCSSAGCLVVSWDGANFVSTAVSTSGGVSAHASTIVAGSVGEAIVVPSATGYLAVWVDYSGPSAGVWTQTLSPAGVPSSNAAAHVYSFDASASGHVLHLHGAASSSQLLLALRTSDVNSKQQFACQTMRIGFDGAAIDSAPVSISASVGCWSVAGDGTSFLVGDILPDTVPDYAPSSLVAQKIGSDGVAVGAPVVKPMPLLSGTLVAGEGPCGALASDGSGYLLLTSDEGAYYSVVLSTLLDGAGNVKAGPSLVNPVPVSTSSAGASTNGSETLVAWSDNRAWPEGYGVYGSLVAPDGGVTARAFPIAPATNADTYAPPAVAAAGASGYLAAFRAYLDGGSAIEAALVTSAGASSPPFVIDTQATTRGEANPSVASDGTAYMAAWTNAGGAFNVERIDALGHPIDDGGITVGQGALSQASLPMSVAATPTPIAWNGSAYVVAWETAYGGSASTKRIFAEWLSADAHVVAGPVSVAFANASDDIAAVACAPSECVVAWGGSLQRFDPKGAPLGAPVLVPGFVNQVAWDGRAFVITWTSAASIVAQWMATDGVLLGQPVALAPYAQQRGALASASGASILAYTGAVVDVQSDAGNGGEAPTYPGTVTAILFASDVPEPTDAGLYPPDASDASTVSSSEAGVPSDAGPLADAEGPENDGGVVTDAGGLDAASTLDASAPDPDGGSTPVNDAGSPGELSDAGRILIAPAEPAASDGCGCSAAGSKTTGTSAFLGIAFAFALGLRRRSRRQAG